jgi:hypothetical protein
MICGFAAGHTASGGPVSAQVAALTTYHEVEADPGVADKRLLVYEPEFANVLKQCERQGNTVSVLLRQARDGGRLGSFTKNSPARATDAHVGLIGHITAAELHRYLTQTESANGFGNRHLWVCAERSKQLSDGGRVDPERWSNLRQKFTDAFCFARDFDRPLRRDDEAREQWHKVYGRLSEGRPGLAGALLARAEAHVLRLTMVYALLDQSGTIRLQHLKAALALWDYCERSVYYVFGDETGDPLADELLRLLRGAPLGIKRTDINRHFDRNQTAGRIERALNQLRQYRMIRAEKDKAAGPGRPAERWFAVAPDGN